MTHRTSLAAAALVALALPRVAAADCAMVVFRAQVLTPTHTNVATRGGVVVAHLATTDGDTGKAFELDFRDGKRLSEPRIVAIAPGLDRYEPTVKAPSFTVVDPDKPLLEITTSTAAPPELPAPDIAGLVYTDHPGRHGWAELRADLHGDPPAGAIALVVYDRSGRARSFGTVVTNAKQVVLYATSQCGGPVAGTVASPVGDDIRLAWVHASGVLSKQTALIRVK